MPEQLSSSVTYEEQAGVGIWTIADLDEALESGELEAGEDHFRERAGSPDMDGVVIHIEEVDTAGASNTLEHVEQEWTELANETGIARTAYVADGLARMAIAQRNQAEECETKGFSEFDEGLEWAQNA
ncbi:hypothetical protein SAMN05216388_102633 [Halorientalis persicus]|uniref:SpoIIAA-like n=1 Tax=Halorientalis persicus TaxID=1367881 RepID=A0A1H8U932_9EURY|nr:hypothetical protein [Halorientalis persicus]SEO99719.1 hypothetical protein SAMN05216388_102633 [Halorientalis persicus]